MQSRFRQLLMDWNRLENQRNMPWKGEKDPYRIWLSEVILQQTRVEQGWAYYERFVTTYPAVADLARAPEQDVFKCWEGLGYYSRARNLIHTARHIYHTLGGRFPDSYPEILGLKGVGPYTAAAIASFAYNLPHAVVDGNVTRVLTRIFGIADPVEEAGVKKRILELANQCLDREEPGRYNQAMMDFGATVCKPQQPLCAQCPMQSLCVAFQQERVAEIPFKTPRPARRQRWFHYLVIQSGQGVLLRQRQEKDVWRHLYEPFLLESEKPLTSLQLNARISAEPWLSAAGVPKLGKPVYLKQLLTHQGVHLSFYIIGPLKKGLKIPEGYQWYSINQLSGLAFPKTVADYFRNAQLSR
jgi:A/G-specific adenine glycosylase